MKFQHKPNQDEIESIKKSQQVHNILFELLFDILTEIQTNHKAIFRRIPDGRIKSFGSLIKKFADREDKSLSMTTFLKGLDDIAGLRLTITTKDEFDEAKSIMRKSRAIKAIGKLDIRKRSKENGIMNKRGYSAHHYYVISSSQILAKYLAKRINEDISNEAKEKYNSLKDRLQTICASHNCNQIIAEIQIRTLAQDLWAVFEHPERYKGSGKSSKALNEELLNYARLMDVADDIAQLTKNRKIYEAEEYLMKQNKGLIGTKKILKIDDIKKILNGSIFKNSVNALSTFDLCEIMIHLANNNIFTNEDFEELIGSGKYIEAIKTAFAELSLKMSDLRVSFLDWLPLFFCCLKYEKDCEDICSRNIGNVAKEIHNRENEFKSELKNKVQEIWEESQFTDLFDKYTVS